VDHNPKNPHDQYSEKSRKCSDIKETNSKMLKKQNTRSSEEQTKTQKRMRTKDPELLTESTRKNKKAGRTDQIFFKQPNQL